MLVFSHILKVVAFKKEACEVILMKNSKALYIGSNDRNLDIEMSGQNILWDYMVLP